MYTIVVVVLVVVESIVLTTAMVLGLYLYDEYRDERIRRTSSLIR